MKIILIVVFLTIVLLTPILSVSDGQEETWGFNPEAWYNNPEPWLVYQEKPSWWPENPWWEEATWWGEHHSWRTALEDTALDPFFWTYWHPRSWTWQYHPEATKEKNAPASPKPDIKGQMIAPYPLIKALKEIGTSTALPILNAVQLQSRHQENM